MDDEHEPTPWERAVRAHEDALAIGTRVRVRLHGEYPVFSLSSGSQIAAHQPTEDGRIGVVSEIIRDDTACMFRVRFDEPFPPFPGYETTIDEWLYTVTELVPLVSEDSAPEA